jgi:hypothetical protein
VTSQTFQTQTLSASPSWRLAKAGGERSVRCVSVNAVGGSRFGEPRHSAQPTKAGGDFIVYARLAGMIPSFFYTTAAFSSPTMLVLLCRTLQVGHVFSRGCCSARTHGLSLADLARGRRCLDRLSRNGVGSTFFPWASPIPREARKSLRRHPPLRPAGGCVVDRLRQTIAIEAAMVAGVHRPRGQSVQRQCPQPSGLCRPRRDWGRLVEELQRGPRLPLAQARRSELQCAHLRQSVR